MAYESLVALASQTKPRLSKHSEQPHRRVRSQCLNIFARRAQGHVDVARAERGAQYPKIPLPAALAVPRGGETRGRAAEVGDFCISSDKGIDSQKGEEILESMPSQEDFKHWTSSAVREKMLLSTRLQVKASSNYLFKRAEWSRNILSFVSIVFYLANASLRITNYRLSRGAEKVIENARKQSAEPTNMYLPRSERRREEAERRRGGGERGGEIAGGSSATACYRPLQRDRTAGLTG